MTTQAPPLYEIDPEGCYRFVRKAAPGEIIKLATCIMESKLNRGDVLTNPGDARRFLTFRMGQLEHEVFACLFLDNRHRVIIFQPMFRGTIDGASVHPREVVKAALKHNAAAVILCHNHPSGIPEPSRADEALTRQLKDALSLISVRVLDHIIVAGTETVSLAERGVL